MARYRAAYRKCVEQRISSREKEKKKGKQDVSDNLARTSLMQDDIPGGITRYDKTHGGQRLYTRTYVSTEYSRGKMASQVEDDRIGGVSIGARFETRSLRRYSRMYGTRGPH